MTNEPLLPCEVCSEPNPFIYGKGDSPEPHDFTGTVICTNCKYTAFSVKTWNARSTPPVEPTDGAPETIWAEPDGDEILIHNGAEDLDQLIQTGYLYEYTLKSTADEALSTLQARVTELERKLGGGCDANDGGLHTVIKQGKYAFCGECGETLKGVRYNHALKTPTEDG